MANAILIYTSWFGFMVVCGIAGYIAMNLLTVILNAIEGRR